MRDLFANFGEKKGKFNYIVIFMYTKIMKIDKFN